MSPTDAGLMDREIQVQTATKSQNADTGEEVITWPVTDRLWAQWVPGGTREVYQASQRLEAFVDGIFRIYRRSPMPTPDRHRIVADGIVYDVKPPVDRGRIENTIDIPVVARI